MAYECTEIGGQLEGSDERGRIYAFSEIVTGVPTNGIGFARKEVVPKGWTAGSEITDAVGDNYTIEYLDNKSADTFSGDNTTDEKNHPTLKMQIQGICPYGWHIANASDCLDLGIRRKQGVSRTLLSSEGGSDHLQTVHNSLGHSRQQQSGLTKRYRQPRRMAQEQDLVVSGGVKTEPTSSDSSTSRSVGAT